MGWLNVEMWINRSQSTDYLTFGTNTFYNKFSKPSVKQISLTLMGVSLIPSL